MSDGDCVVCIMPVEIPVRLRCSHVFCFSCTKGLLKSTKSCPLCRATITLDLLLEPEEFFVGVLPVPQQKYSWFYKTYKGWWLFAPRMQIEIEQAFQSKKSAFEITNEGESCVIDFANSEKRIENSFRRQQIKRDLSTSTHVGVAGIRYTSFNT